MRAVLRGHIAAALLVRLVAGGRGHHDDIAATGIDQRRQNGFDDAEDTEDVDVEHVLPPLDRGLRDRVDAVGGSGVRSEEHTSELQSRFDLVCRLLLEKKNKQSAYK